MPSLMIKVHLNNRTVKHRKVNNKINYRMTKCYTFNNKVLNNIIMTNKHCYLINKDNHK